jgi:hypothetical protein
VSAETDVALATCCLILGAPRSTIYARAAGAIRCCKRGPSTSLSDEELTELIR